MKYEENPQTPRTGFPSYLESANPALSTFPPHGYCCCPDQKQSKRAVELHTTSMTYPQILLTRHFILLSSECGERV